MTTRLENGFSKFIIVWLGQLISNIGSGLTGFTLGVYAFRMTGSASCYSLIVLWAFLPSYLLTPIGGVLADRFDRRLLIALSDIGSVLGLIYILAVMYSGPIKLWQIYAGVGISSVFGAARSPAYKASVSDLLPPDQYAKASGLVQLAGSAQYLLSPMIAGILISFIDVKHIIWIDILSFLVAVITVFTVRKHMTQVSINQGKGAFFSEMADGFKATIADKGIFSLICITSLVLFYIGMLQCLFGPMVMSFASARTFGIAQSTCASGMLFSSFLIGIFGQRKGQSVVLAVFLGLMGLFFALLGFSTNIIIVSIPCFLFFITIPFVNSSIDVLIRKNIDNKQEGRIWSFVSVITYMGSLLAYLTAGYLADWVFNPLFNVNGLFANLYLGKIIGIGPGRGIAFMFLISGLSVIILAFFSFTSKKIRALDIT